MKHYIMYFLIASIAHLYSNSTIDHVYDDQNRLIEVTSLDKKEGYHYTYNSLGQIVEALDLQTREKVIRVYNSNGDLEEEILPNDLHVQYTYDINRRRTNMILPDRSSVDYIYEGNQKKTIQRKSPSGHILYSHSYLFSLEDRLIVHEDMIENSGSLTKIYNTEGRCIHLTTPLGIEKILSTDSHGNILEMERLTGKAIYSYDSKLTLTKEQNRLNAHDYTTLTSASAFSLKYDKFHRLISIQMPEEYTFTYTYDGFHRPLVETHYVWENNRWKEIDQTYFIYDHHHEIGSYNVNKRCKDLRVLGLMPTNDSEVSIAMEVKGEIYAPIHDLFGNIVSLISVKDHSIAEITAYHALGEEPLEKPPLSPWRFLSKRMNPTTGLLSFGKYFYDVNRCCWLLPHLEVATESNQDLYPFPSNRNGFDSTIKHSTEQASYIKPLGQFMQDYFYHAIAVSGIRYLGIWVGEKLGANPIPKNYYESDMGVVGDKSRLHTHVNVWINGMNTDLENTKSYAQFISKVCGGEKVYYAYNSTSGFSADAFEYVLDKYNYQTSACKIAIKTLRQAISDIGGVESKGYVTVFAHSQGGMIFEAALRDLTAQEQNLLEVYTFGSSSLFSKKHLRFVKHIISYRDLIPCCVDPWGILYSYLFDDSHLTFIDSLEEGLMQNHYFMGQTYQNEVIKIGNEIQNNRNPQFN
jgi:YD repeat-containing protein